MSTERTRSLRAAATVVLALAAAPVPSAAAAQPRAVDAATTGVNSELRRTVPITRTRDAQPRVVLSMGPGKLAGLRQGDRLELSSEVQVTVDCDKPSPRCAGRPYDYDPRVTVALEVAGRKSASAPARVLARRHLRCRQRLPNREHHCPVVFDRTTRIGDGFPCRLDHCYANVVVSASSPHSRGDERMIIGANKPNGRIVQNKGRLNAIRIPPGVTAQRDRTKKLRRGSLRLRPRRKVVLSQKVDRLRRGDVLAVTAALRSDVRRLGYTALVGGQLVVARGPRATTPTRLVRRSVWLQGMISPTNGTNCTPAQSPCETRKAGVVKVRRDVHGGSGGSAPLFVNLVIRTKQKRVDRQHGARLKLLRGRLEVRRYR